MSKRGDRKTLKVVFPVINRGRKMSESQSRLEKKKEDLEILEVDAEILTVQEKIKKRQDSGEPAQDRVRGKEIGDRLIDEVLIPMIRDKTREPDRSGKGDSVTLKALELLKTEREKGGKGEPKSSVSAVKEVISVIQEVRGLVEDKETIDRLDKMQKSIEDIEEGRKKGDPIDEFERMIKFVDTIKESFGIRGSDQGGDSAALIEHQRWATQFEAKEKTRDRAWTLRLRQMDKKHDLDMAKLSVEKERNEMFDSGLTRLGEAFLEAVTDDDLEDGSLAKVSGKELVQIPCANEGCGVMLTIPPEAQHPGAKISCPKCKSKFEVTGE